MKTVRIIGRWLMASVAVATALAMATGCRPTKYVGEGEYLLDKVSVRGNLDKVSAADFQDYIRQQPNGRILGFWRLNLGVYNLSRPRDKAISNWLRRVGEAPVIYDSAFTARTSEQLRLYMENRGYFDAEVTDTMILTGKKKCAVVYNIEAGLPYKVKSLNYSIADTALHPVVMGDTANALVHTGDNFDVWKHDEERNRIARRLHESGYFYFGKDYIYFLADSSKTHHSVSDSLVILNSLADNVRDLPRPHRQAIVDDVWFVLNRIDSKPIDLNTPDYDTTRTSRVAVAHRGPLVVNPRLLEQSCFVRSGELYNIEAVEETQSRFNSLRLFSNLNIRFQEITDTTRADDGLHHLKCIVTTTIGHQQSYSASVEGTNSSGNLGVAASLNYKHANIFRKAEVLDVKWRIASQKQTARSGKDDFYTLETGVEASVTVPKALVPFASTNTFSHRRNPTTRFMLAYDYQRRPDFTKSVVATRVGYSWRGGSPHVRHTFTPVELNMVSIPVISNDFKNYVDKTYLRYSYTDHLIFSANYTYLYNQQTMSDRLGDARYARLSIETAGNLLQLLTQGKKNQDGEPIKVMGIDYSQYVRAEAELRYQISDLWSNRFVYRLYAGVGIPYGNSKALPFEKSFFVGGANSIRAWQVRALGPGSQKSDNSLRYNNQTSDIRLEMNMEYRFKLISLLEGALFADAGNIWALPRKSNAPEARFGSHFYEQVAVGSGLGLRLNFSYFVIRLDAAIKLRDPSEPEGERWVIGKQRFTGSDINYNFAIGYPF